MIHANLEYAMIPMRALARDFVSRALMTPQPDPFLNENFDPADMFAVFVENALPEFLQPSRSQPAFMTEQQTVEVNVVLHVGEVRDHEGSYLSVDGRLTAHGSHDFIVHQTDLLHHHDGVEFLFPAEKMVETPDGKSGGFRDLSHRCLVETLRGKDLFRMSEDLGAANLKLFFLPLQFPGRIHALPERSFIK